MKTLKRHGLWICLALCSAVLLSWVAPAAPAATPVIGSEGFQVDVPTLGLRFTTPEDWVLAKASREDELLLFGDAKKQTPLLRIRSFAGRLSAEDRLSSMKRELPEGEAQVKFVSSEKWDAGGRFYVTARAVFTSGTKEWHAFFTVIDQPKKLQHGFWLYGKKKDLDRHWPAIQASIASAKSIPNKGRRPVGEQPSEADRRTSSEPVWKDATSGLRLGSWPAGFALDTSTEKALGKDGVILRPLDERAHSATLFRLTVLDKQPEEASVKAADQLEAELAGNPNAKSTRRVPLRVGGQPGFMLRWTETTKGKDSFLHEVYFTQKGAMLVRIDFVALEEWARARSRRTLVKDFVAGVALR